MDNTFDNVAPMSGSIPSPVASQMSNMSNPNKIIRMISGRDRGSRKAKGLKVLMSYLAIYISIKVSAHLCIMPSRPYDVNLFSTFIM